MRKFLGVFIIFSVVVFGLAGNAIAIPILGTPTDNGSTATVGTVDSSGEVRFFIPIDRNRADGTYGVDDGGTYGTLSDSTTVPPAINGPLLSMYLLFDIPDGQIGSELTLAFTDLDLIPYNDPDPFYEKLTLNGEGGLPTGTFTSYNGLGSSVISASNNGSVLTFSNLAIGPGDSWIHLGFEAYSDDGNLLPALSDGRWRNTAEYLTATLNTQSNPVPEPATIFLIGTGLLGLAGFGRKKFFKK